MSFALAQGQTGHEGMPGMKKDTAPPVSTPAATRPVLPRETKTNQTKSGQPNLTPRLQWPSPVTDNADFSFFLLDPFELRREDGGTVLRYDIVGWRGGDRDRIWFKSEGNQSLSGNEVNQADFQILKGRLISPFFDFLYGLRYEQRYGPGVPYRGRPYFSVGLQGIAPYRFEIEPFLFLSPEGNVQLRFTGSYSVQVTERLVLTPRIEVNGALSRLAAMGVEPGINELEFGLRLRYEIRRDFAPYIGYVWSNTGGSSDAYGRRSTGRQSNQGFVLGLRRWF